MSFIMLPSIKLNAFCPRPLNSSVIEPQTLETTMPFFKKEESLTSGERLLGTWRLLNQTARSTRAMPFMANGRLLYVIHAKQSDEIMNLWFTVERDRIVTNQPSRPQMESAQFSFDSDHLVLDYDGGKSWFARA